jgi:hypothetical protein
MELTDILRELERCRFFGTLELKFESGRVVLVRKTETLKPTTSNYRDNRGEGDEHESAS